MGTLFRLIAFLIMAGAFTPGFSQGFGVGGTVTSSTGEPLPGVNIIVKGTTQGAVTDINGQYQLEVSDPAAAVLSFNFIGFVSVDMPVNNRSVLNVVLEEEFVNLQEVVAVGYGVMRRSDLTGAVSSVKAEDIASNPSNNALEALQGKISGLDLTRSSGQAGSGLSFTVRGERSLQASNAPLILVDGVEYGSSLDINPSDIESIEVLKDASSTAIYGSRGANGVMLITTKRGAEGVTKISFNSYYSFNSLTAMPDFMNGEQYVQLKRDAYKTTGDWSSPADDANIFAPLELDYIQDGKFVDWMDLIFNDGYTQNYEVSLSGGNQDTQYLLSMGYMDEQGLLSSNDQFKRYNGRLTLDHQVRDNIKVGGSALFTYKNQDKRYAPFNQATKILPIAQPYNEDGSVSAYPVPGYTSQMNPLLDDVAGAVKDNRLENRFFGSAYFDWELLKDLKFRSTLGVDMLNRRDGYFYAKTTLQTLDVASRSGAENYLAKNVTWENILTYDFKLAERHSFSLLGGTSTIDKHREIYNSDGKSQASALNAFHDLSSNTSEIQINSDLVEEQMASFFGRVNYKFDERYLLTASLRADGSSVLAEGNKWGYFPSLAAAWRLSEEGFLSGSDVLSNLKLRLSWGESGQSAIAPYSTLGGLGSSTYAFGNTGAFGYYPRDISNPDLSWETTSVVNFGIDFGVYNNRISGSVDLYQSNTRDLLMARLVPNTTGFSSVMENVGETKGNGVDINVSTLNVDGSDLRWSTDLTLTYNKNEIVQLSGGVERDVANNWFVGEPISVFYDYRQIGIWQLNEESRAADYGQIPGDIKVEDVDDNGSIDADDRVVYNRSPKFTFGLTNRFSYKQFDLTVFAYGRFGHYINYEWNTMYKSDALESGSAVDYWTPDNPVNKFPSADKARSYRNRAYQSSLGYEKGDFWKIRDITLAYNFSRDFMDRLNVDRLKVYVTLKNHFTFSDLDNYDPERGGSLNYPLTKQTVFGLSLDF